MQPLHPNYMPYHPYRHAGRMDRLNSMRVEGFPGVREKEPKGGNGLGANAAFVGWASRCSEGD
jgi:hypothetical protein